MAGCWILSSLFSEQRNWACILRDGIKPIIFELPSIGGFRIRFNYLNGSNIQLALLTNENQCESIAKKIDLYFKGFFSESGLYKKPLNLPLESLFISFPQNSIHYGLFEINPKIEEERNDFHQLLSELILATLTNDVDDTSILTLGLYLHLTLVKAYHKCSNNSRGQSDSFLLKMYPINSIGTEFAEDIFTESKDTLIEILEDVFVKEFIENDDLFWLTRWKKFCENEIEKNITRPNGLYQIFAHTINEFLGLNIESLQVLNYLMYKTIYLERKDLVESDYIEYSIGNASI